VSAGNSTDKDAVLLTQSFDSDFKTLTDALSPHYNGSAFAFSRYADGEAAIIFGREHKAKSDGWHWTGAKSDLPERLLDSLHCDLFGWHVGITCEDHHRLDHHALLKEVRTPFVTFAEIFIFANYQRFCRLDLSHCLTIGFKGEIKTPKTPDDPAWAKTIDDLVPFMAECNRPMLVSAGPWACVLIHEYWKRCPKQLRRVVLDVGSALNTGRRTRTYQKPSSGLNSWVPRWKLG
jgi:hypothetical protein